MKKKNLYWCMMVVIAMAVMSVGFASCGDDDDDAVSNKALVGTWARSVYGYVIGFKLTGDGKCYYNEWNKGAQPDFSNVSKPATAKVTDTTLRITHSQVPDYYEEYNYVVSNDGKSVSLMLIGYEKDCHHLEGTFTKYE